MRWGYWVLVALGVFPVLGHSSGVTIYCQFHHQAPGVTLTNVATRAVGNGWTSAWNTNNALYYNNTGGGTFSGDTAYAPFHLESIVPGWGTYTGSETSGGATPSHFDFTGAAPVYEYISKGCVTNWSPNPKKFILSYSDGTAEESPVLYANQPVNWWCSRGKTNANPFTTTINEIVYNSDLGTNWNNIYGPYWAGTNSSVTGGTGYTGGAPGTGGTGTGGGSTNPVTGDQIATINTNQTTVMYQGFQSILGGLRTLGQQLGSNSAPDYSGVLGQIRTNTENTVGGLGALNTNFFGGTNGYADTNGFLWAAGRGTNAFGGRTNVGAWGVVMPTVGSNPPVFVVPLSALEIDGYGPLTDAELNFGSLHFGQYLPTIRGFCLVIVTYFFVIWSFRILGKAGGM